MDHIYQSAKKCQKLGGAYIIILTSHAPYLLVCKIMSDKEDSSLWEHTSFFVFSWTLSSGWWKNVRYGGFNFGECTSFLHLHMDHIYQSAKNCQTFGNYIFREHTSFYNFICTIFGSWLYRNIRRLRSMVGLVIQATGRPEFEDGFRPGSPGGVFSDNPSIRTSSLVTPVL